MTMNQGQSGNVIWILGNKKEGFTQPTHTTQDWLVGTETFFDPLLSLSLAKMIDLDITDWQITSTTDTVQYTEVYIHVYKCKS